MNIQRLYLPLAIVGFAVPGALMIMESVQTGNILFWTDPARTTQELFANRTSTTFALDLFGVVTVALLWITHEAARIGVRNVWRFWVIALLFGIAGTLPLFLWERERRLQHA